MTHKIGFSDPKSYPVTLRSEILKKIFSIVSRGQCVQLVGVTGSGKSLLIRAMVESEQIRKFHLGKYNEEHGFVLVDIRLLVDNNISSVLKLILSKLGGKHTNKDLSTLVVDLEKTIAEKTDKGRHLTIIFDSYNEIPNPKQLFEVLKGLYDQHRGNLSYIFAVNHEVNLTKAAENFGIITPILSENILFIPPLSPADYNWYIHEIEKHLDVKLDSKIKDQLYILSGGYMSTVKRLAEVIKEGVPLSQIEKNPGSSDRLTYHFQIILKDLKSEEKTLLDVVRQGMGSSNQTNIKYLQKTYILDLNGDFVIKAFEVYLRNSETMSSNGSTEIINDKININSRLTGSEFRILRYLCSKPDEFCSREEIIDSVWNTKANSGISDHALDQLIYRLRKKLEKSDPKIKVETVWGRGHKAVLLY